MRAQLSLLALPALCLAEQQPLGAYFKSLVDKVSSYIPTSLPTANPINSAAAKVAGMIEVPLTFDNWKSTLQAGAPRKTGEPDEWIIYITGGNRTCYGRCDNTTAAWNSSVAILAAQPYAPNLGLVDCEEDGLLCALWSVGPPSIYHMLFPHGGSGAPTIRWFPLNATDTTAADIVEIHTKRTFEKVEPYEGIFNPYTGLLAQSGLAVPIAYVLWGVTKMPSWLPMIIISFLSRSFMNRRMPQANRQAAAPAPAAAPAGS